MRLSLAALKKLPESTRDVVLSSACAVSAAFCAVAFLWVTNFLFQESFVRFARGGPALFLPASLAVIMGTAAAVGLLLRLSPDAAGSGVPQLKAAYWKDLGFVRWRSVWVKFAAGALSLGGGMSLGREGPTVFVGGGAGSNLAGLLGAPKQRRRPASVAGAAAGLAAAFNTPLASITFVLEEMLGEFSSRVLGGVVLAGVAGALVVSAVLGPRPAFALPEVGAVSWLLYLLVPAVAATAAAIGIAFQRLTIGLRGRVRARSRLPRWLRPAWAALLTWVLGAGAFLLCGRTGVFGLGYIDLSAALRGGVGWQIAGMLVPAKFLATVICYGWEGCGGIFSPTLFLGGMTGVFLAGLSGTWIPISASDQVVLAAVGMSSCFNAVVRAPLTSVLIVFEMTHQFAFVPALMLGTLISQTLSRLASRHNFYDTLLLQDGHELIRIKPPRDLHGWQNLPVSQIARTHPVVLTDLDPQALRQALDQHPYRRFPVASGGVVRGVAGREEIEAALRERRLPALQRPVFCPPEMTVREVGDLLIDSPSGIVLVSSDRRGGVQAIVTLHDLLRAQAALLE